MTVRACAALAAVLLGGCAVAPAPDAFITGSAISRERLYVPPGAMFDAELVDITRAGEPPTVLGRQRIAPAGPPPYALHIPFHQSRLQLRGRYEVRAAVRLDGRLLLDMPGSHPALIDPAYRHADVILARVPLLAATATAAVPLRQTYWKLVEVVGGAAVSPPAADADAAHLVLQREGDRATGSGGCNRFVARYRTDGGQLGFHSLSSGMRLCLKDGTSELAYVQQLMSVASYMQQGHGLELRDADGKPLLRFVAEEWGEPPLPDEDAPQPA